MEFYCNGTFWNVSSFWNSDYPNFSECFRDTVFSSVPCGFLWLSFPFWLFWTRNYDAKFKIKISFPHHSRSD